METGWSVRFLVFSPPPSTHFIRHNNCRSLINSGCFSTCGNWLVSLISRLSFPLLSLSVIITVGHNLRLFLYLWKVAGQSDFSSLLLLPHFIRHNNCMSLINSGHMPYLWKLAGQSNMSSVLLPALFVRHNNCRSLIDSGCMSYLWTGLSDFSSFLPPPHFVSHSSCRSLNNSGCMPFFCISIFF